VATTTAFTTTRRGPRHYDCEDDRNVGSECNGKFYACSPTESPAKTPYA